jgi:hypothetical protein
VKINTHHREESPFPSLDGGEGARKFRPRRKGLKKQKTTNQSSPKRKFWIWKEEGRR